jgi:hypothetical protein
MLHFVVLCSALVIGASSLRVTLEPAVSDFFEDEVAAMKSHFRRPGAESARLIHVAQDQNSLKPLMFIHVHKSLGTWMCFVVKHAGGSSVIGNPDCTMPEDSCWSSSAFGSKSTCAARMQQFNANHWTFYEIERWLDFADDAGDWCPEDLSYAIILRDPVKRAASQMSANHQTMDDIKGWFDSPVVFDRRQGFISSHVSYDNFYVRTLCGVECFFLPPGALSAEHLEKAKGRLEKLDAVLMVDDLLTHVVQLDAITNLTGLQDYSKYVVHNNACTYGGSDCAKFIMTEEDEAFLRSRNQLDVELYQHAAEVASRKMDALR